MKNLILRQYRLTGVLNDGTLDNDSTLKPLSAWAGGQCTMGNTIGPNAQIYSLQVYGCPGTLFYLNNGLIPIELGPSGYYALELNDFAGIYKLEFDEENLATLYGSSAGVAIPLVVDAKIKYTTN